MYEDVIIGRVDRWLAREFAPHHLTEAIRDLAAAAGQADDAQQISDDEETSRKIAECDGKLTTEFTLDGGADDGGGSDHQVVHRRGSDGRRCSGRGGVLRARLRSRGRTVRRAGRLGWSRSR